MGSRWLTVGMTVAERLAFYSRPQKNGCLLWIGATVKSGSGRIRINGKNEVVARAAWKEHHKRSIPKDLKVLHTCDVPACIRKKHLFLGTQADNVADMDAKGRRVVRRGEQKATKLTAKKVRAIRRDQRNYRIVARQYKIHPQYVYQIRNRAKWSHL